MIKAGRIALGAFVVALFISGCGGEAGDPDVITLAGRGVPLSELVYEFNRIFGEDQWETVTPEVREQFVETYARKELLAEKARQIYGAELPQREQLIFARWLEKEAVRRFWMLYRASLAVPQAYIDSLSRVMREERYFRHLVCNYEDDAREIYAKIKEGASFDDVAAEFVERNPNAVVLSEPGWVNRPSLDPAIGDVLFALAAPGDVAEPCETRRWGWHVIRLDSLRSVAPDQAALAAEDVGGTNYRRETVATQVEVVKKHYSFSIVEENLAPLMRHFRAMYDSLSADKRMGKEVDYQALPPPLHRFSAEERALPLVRWSGGVFTIEDFVNSLWDIDLDYWPTVGDDVKILSQIKRRMTRWSFMEEAKKAGTLEDPEFLLDQKRKQDELYLDRFHEDHLKIYGDRVTDEDVRNFWEENTERYLTNDMVGYGFMRFPPDARELAQRSAEGVRGGMDWGIVATQARRTDERVFHEPHLDPTDGPPYPEITEVAMQFDPGEEGPIYTDPLQLPDGDWVVLKVYFRSHPRSLSFDMAKDFVRRDLQRVAMEDTLLARLDDFRSEFDLKINRDAIR